MENKKEQEHGEQEEKIEIIFWYPGKYLDKLQSYFCFFWCVKYKVYEAPKILVEKTIVTKTSI